MPEVEQNFDPGWPEPNGELLARLAALRAGAAITVIGLDPARLGNLLSRAPVARRMLRLEFAGAATAAVAIDRILNDLADLAAALAPDWGDEPTPTDGPRLWSGWRRAAARFTSGGRRPRFRQLAPETELVHLLSVLPDLVMLADVSPSRSERAAPVIAALDWCRRHGAAVATLLGEEPAHAPPWDVLLYDAITVAPLPVAPAVSRLIPLAGTARGGSATERRLRTALRDTADLAGLFEDEVTLQLGPLGPTPRVDLLWRHGKVVVELDGAEHERDPNYGADRHRDYELLVAGYLVLRLTNAEVQLDLSRSLDKVRRVVNLRRTQP